ncbi:MAG TPA: hypothetical protein VFP86_14160 [bacterium]|nr:hypothetical protein [bacterium]
MPKMLWGVFGLVFAMAVVAQGTYAAEMGMADELKTAITHAGFAEKYDSMKEVSLHLHHVVNCLVGEGDPMFDKASGNPCQGQGKGIMPDIKAKMGQDQEYQVAWWLAHMGSDALKMGNLAQAKAAAHIIGVQLTAMSKM